MSAEVPPPQDPQTPPRTPKRAQTLPGQSLSPLQSSPGPFSNLPSFIYSGRDGCVEVYEDRNKADPGFDADEDLGFADFVPTPPLPAKITLQQTPTRAAVSLRKSTLSDVTMEDALPASSSPTLSRTKAKGSWTPRMRLTRISRAGIPSTPSGSLRLLGFQSMGSPTPDKSSELKTEIMQNISCMPNRDCCPEEYRVEAYKQAQISGSPRPPDVPEGSQGFAPLYEPTVHTVEDAGLGLLDVPPAKEVFMSNTPELCGVFTFTVPQSALTSADAQ